MRALATIAVSLALASSTIGQETLSIADPAPPLGEIVEWLRGEPMGEYPQGQITVLEFWAPWCDPCYGAMPHLSDIADRYASDNVRVVGVSVWPREGMTPVEQVVEQQGDTMRYDLAIDTDNVIANAYLLATGSDAIPTSMVINTDGTLAWIGHPMDEQLEQVIEHILEGTYDSSFIKEQQKRLARAEGLVREANQLAYNRDWESAIVKLQEAFDIDPERFAQYAVLKFQRLMLTLDRPGEAYDYARALLESPVAQSPRLLENMARFVAEAPGIEPRDLDFAHDAAQLAVDLTGGSWGEALSTLASVWHEKGEHEAAVKTMRRAVILATDQESNWLPEYQVELELYESLWNETKPPPY
ncbi:MAG: peroxiredoxin family protein [Planctomycetota bacterium]|jgi:thiol-disulfide isomerase/thioredoxin